MQIKSCKYGVAGRPKERIPANEVRVKQSYKASLVLLLSASHFIGLLHSFVVTYDKDPQLFVCEHLAEPLGHSQSRRAAVCPPVVGGWRRCIGQTCFFGTFFERAQSIAVKMISILLFPLLS